MFQSRHTHTGDTSASLGPPDVVACQALRGRRGAGILVVCLRQFRRYGLRVFAFRQSGGPEMVQLRPHLHMQTQLRGEGRFGGVRVSPGYVPHALQQQADLNFPALRIPASSMGRRGLFVTPACLDILMHHSPAGLGDSLFVCVRKLVCAGVSRILLLH